MKANDIKYVMEELTGDGAFKRSGGVNLMFNCPMCEHNHKKQDTKHKLGILVQPGTAICNCFRPGCFHGTLMDLVTAVGGKKIQAGEETLESIGNLKAFIIMAEEEELDADDLIGAKKTIQPIPPEILQALGTGSTYFEGRGVTTETASEWRLGEFGGRALLPIRGRDGSVVGVQGRLLPGTDKDSYPFDHHHFDAKHRSWPDGFRREEHLLGEHLLTKPADFIVVVESPLDALLLNQWLPDLDPQHLPYDTATDGIVAVSVLGGKFSTQQVRAAVGGLSPQGEIVAGFDSDHAGRLAQRRFVDAARLFVPNVSEIEWPGTDPSDDNQGSFSQDKVKERALKAVATREFWFSKRMKTRIGIS